MYSFNILRNLYRVNVSRCYFYCTKKSSENFIPVYKFPYIRVAGVVNRLKFYQTTLTAISVPTAFILGACNLISGESFLITAAYGEIITYRSI